MQVVLVMFRNDGERRSFSVVRNITVIGRREDCDLRIPVGDVSRKHCRLVLTDEGVRIEDLGSSNGTHVNGQRVQESELNPGDVVGIGPVQFIVQIDGVPDEDDMTPPGERSAMSHSVNDDSSAGGSSGGEEAALLVDPDFYGALVLPDLSQPAVLDQQSEGQHSKLRLRYEFVGHLDPMARRLLGPSRLAWVQEIDLDRESEAGTLRFYGEADPKRLHGSADFGAKRGRDGHLSPPDG